NPTFRPSGATAALLFARCLAREAVPLPISPLDLLSIFTTAFTIFKYSPYGSEPCRRAKMIDALRLADNCFAPPANPSLNPGRPVVRRDGDNAHILQWRPLSRDIERPD